MAAFDMDDSSAVISPGGVGFDINCGVRLLRTNLTYRDVAPVKVGFSLYEGINKLKMSLLPCKWLLDSFVQPCHWGLLCPLL